MRTSTRQKGLCSEQEAVNYLRKQGYKILERNFRSPFGEIDVIADESGVICFIEVKMRSSQNFGTAFEAVAYPKQKKISSLAAEYLRNKNQSDSHSRFDVIAVSYDSQGNPKIDLLRNAFEYCE